MDARGNQFVRLGVVTLLAGWASSCAEPLQSVTADPSRSTSPPPSCVTRLASTPDSERGFMRQLTEPEIFGAVFPRFDSEGKVLPEGAVACNGLPVFDDPAFAGTGPRGGYPVRLGDDSVTYGRGANRMRVVWLKTHQAEDGVLAGPLAIVRTVENLAEVYAVGAYRGHPESSRFGVERMGTEFVVTAVDEGCHGRPQGAPCDSLLTVYVPWQGKLERLVSAPLERVRYYSGGEPGAIGVVEYTLVATPTYEDRVIRLLEQVTATDSAGRELRRAERARLVFVDGQTAQPSTESLWDSLVPAAQEETEGAAPIAEPSPEAAEQGADPQVVDLEQD